MTEAIFAKVAVGTSFFARTTVCRIGLGIDADAVATQRLGRRTGERCGFATPVFAGLIHRASRLAVAAVRCIGLERDTQAPAGAVIRRAEANPLDAEPPRSTIAVLFARRDGRSV